MHLAILFFVSVNFGGVIAAEFQVPGPTSPFCPLYFRSDRPIERPQQNIAME